MFVRPALIPGAPDGARYLIRDPMTMRHLPVEGLDVPVTDYWQRRVADGGVELAEPKAEGEGLEVKTDDPAPAIGNVKMAPLFPGEETHQ